MPPKKAAGSAAVKATQANGTTTDPPRLRTARIKKSVMPEDAPAATTSPKPAVRKTATKAAATKKPAAKKAPAKKTNATKANTAAKRKATEELEDDRVNGHKGLKRSKSSITPEPKPARKIAQPKAKKPRTKGPIINQAPTDPLNIYVFGEGSSGELGLGSAKGQLEVKRPRLNPLLDVAKIGVVQAAVGGMHTAVLTKENKILTWGVNDQGALGRDTAWEGGLVEMDDGKSDSGSDSDSDSDTGVNPYESTPTEVDMSGIPADLTWTQVACTDSATFALTDEGQVYGWGTFRSNEGIFGFDLETCGEDNKIQTRPKLIPSLKKITQLATGANHVLALASNGQVWAWGSGQQNQLGRRVLERFIAQALVPTKVGVPAAMELVGCGSYHSFAVHKNGDVYAWGLNSFGETGIAQDLEEGGESDVHGATIVEALRGHGKIICIEGGAHHTVAVTDKGELLGWGRLDGSQLGLDVKSLPEDDLVFDSNGTPRILKTPTLIPGINAVYCAAGSDHAMAIAKDGKAYSWGFSTTYQTGLGTDDDVSIATHIDNTAVRGKKLVWAGCGGQFSVLAGLAEAPMVNGNGH